MSRSLASMRGAAPCPVGRRHPRRRRSGWSAAIADLGGAEFPTAPRTRGPGSTTDAGTSLHPLGKAQAHPGQPALSLPAGRGRQPAPGAGRSGPCRDHRARSFPLHRPGRDGRPPRGAARLRPQGRRAADAGRRRSPAAPNWPAESRATAPWPMPGPSPRPPRRHWRSRCRSGPSRCAASWRNSNGWPTTWAISGRSATMPPSR